MSDLQCAATIIVARHGEAEYDVDGLTDAGGSLTLTGRDQAPALGESLLDRKVATIWCSDMARAVQTAEIAASVLGCGVKVRAGLREFTVGDLAGQSYENTDFLAIYQEWKQGNWGVGPPGGETGAEVARRFTAELEDLADQYRGETTLVVTHGGVLTALVPMMARNVADTFAWGQTVGNCVTSELAVDADGWVLKSWCGVPLT